MISKTFIEKMGSALGYETKYSVCSICQRPYEGHGNNAQPVNDGRCCDRCNALVVVPRRLSSLRKREK